MSTFCSEYLMMKFVKSFYKAATNSNSHKISAFEQHLSQNNSMSKLRANGKINYDAEVFIRQRSTKITNLSLPQMVKTR